MKHLSIVQMVGSLLIAPALLLTSCSNERSSSKDSSAEQGSATTNRTEKEDKLFSADSAYSYIAHQVSFGPRVPNTEGHKACREWLVQKLSSFGAQVVRQETTVTAHDGKKLDITNIIGSFNPDNPNRILLLAHWDTRPIADHDSNENLRSEPILGADDGGSGVAVLLEIARQLQKSNTSLGIDILLADAEDYGVSNDEESWCLGSTYWSKNPHVANYRADWGILLDMVGAKGAKFRWEIFSKIHAPYLLTAIWDIAYRLGYGSLFIQADGAALTDDHVPVIKNLGIPTINIVNYDPNRPNGFGGHWHTHKDDLENIDPTVLEAVGHTVMTFLKQQEKK